MLRESAQAGTLDFRTARYLCRARLGRSARDCSQSCKALCFSAHAAAAARVLHGARGPFDRRNRNAACIHSGRKRNSKVVACSVGARQASAPATNRLCGVCGDATDGITRPRSHADLERASIDVEPGLRRFAPALRHDACSRCRRENLRCPVARVHRQAKGPPPLDDCNRCAALRVHPTALKSLTASASTTPPRDRRSLCRPARTDRHTGSTGAAEIPCACVQSELACAASKRSKTCTTGIAIMSAFQ